jgi:hypothetical protein
MTTTTQCIHGFPAEQCSSCRICAHGQMTSTCSRCRAATTSRARTTKPSTEIHPSQSHAGFEIYFEPRVSGWRYRADESAPSPLSYRSAFLARKAVDELANGNGAVAEPARSGGKKSKKK